MVDRSRGVEVIDDQIKVSVVVEIPGCHAVGNPLQVKTPLGARGLKPALALIAEGRIARAPPGMQLHGALELIVGEATARVLDFSVTVLIHHIEFEAIGEQQVFVAIEVDIEEQGGPSPVGGRQTCHPSHVGKVPARTPQEESVSVELRPRLGEIQLSQRGTIPNQLGHPKPVFPGQHVDDEEIVVSVPVDVGEINPHGRATGMAQLQRLQFPKLTPALIDPNAVRRGVVVADIEIGCSVTVDVAKHHGQTPISIRRQRRSLRIRKRAGLILDGPEPSLPFIEVQPVHLRQLADLAVGQRLEAALPFGRAGRFAVDLGHLPAIALASEGKAGGGICQTHHIDEVRAVEIEVAVAVDVGQRHRGR